MPAEAGIHRPRRRAPRRRSDTYGDPRGLWLTDSDTDDVLRRVVIRDNARNCATPIVRALAFDRAGSATQSCDHEKRSMRGHCRNRHEFCRLPQIDDQVPR